MQRRAAKYVCVLSSVVLFGDQCFDIVTRENKFPTGEVEPLRTELSAFEIRDLYCLDTLTE